MKSVITHLPARFRPARETERKHVASTSSKLQLLRSKRVASFFQAKAGQRALVSAVGSAVLPLLQSLRQVAKKFSHKVAALFAYPSKWTQKLLALFGKKSVLKSLQRPLDQTLKQISDEKEKSSNEPRRPVYKSVTRALVRLGRLALVAAQEQRRIDTSASLHNETIKDVPKAEVEAIVALQECQRLARRAIVLQRMWRRKKRLEEARLASRARLITLLSDLPRQLELRRKRLAMISETSISLANHWIDRALQRLAARMIQRVWRGYWARKPLCRLRAFKQRKVKRQRQRERLRGACDALLKPSEREQRHHGQVERRMQARTLELLPHRRRQGERVPLLQPLPSHARPSSLAQRIPFSRFEKIRTQGARVNLSNVWVAIPVKHVELSERVRRGRLSPLLVGQGCRQFKETIHTTYDWVPARLLQSKQEREANAERCRQRCRHVSAIRNGRECND